MPAVPWTTGQYTAAADAQLHVLSSTLPMLRYRDVPRFLRWTMKIRKQLASADGCAGYRLDAHLLRKTFYTLSAWQDRDAMNRFVHSGWHAAMLVDMAGRLGKPKFVETAARPGDLPLDWASDQSFARNWRDRS
jgi:hypothetical protein